MTGVKKAAESARPAWLWRAAAAAAAAVALASVLGEAASGTRGGDPGRPAVAESLSDPVFEMPAPSSGDRPWDRTPTGHEWSRGDWPWGPHPR
ncbi:hypothetical protein [Rhizomonospora bruguierae]|uniref:hypothetical protein n=1 Tax=Rhizomonospora bruguierae TaxID=1581705 RepID=UPI001BCCF78C|nr:hypothetical protein [Micromonospora sp. NBRC 107566]